MTEFRQLRAFVLTLSLVALGGHAQTTGPAVPTGTKLSPELARRVEVMIRSKSDVPAEYVIAISDRTKSDVTGFDQISVTFSAEGKTSRPLTFLLSNDNKTLAQFNKFDLSQDPKDKISAAGRPGRGGAQNAPVEIVVFDDLECPYCSRMHAEMFPAVTDRYKDQVRVVYLDFPLTNIHAWAMHAAVDANCLASASPAAYWSFVDYVHANGGDIGGPEHSLAKAGEMLDKLAGDEGTKQKVNGADLTACLKKQDESQIRASMKLGDTLGVSGTPAVFINGEKIDGLKPIEVVYRMIDGALTAEGRTPPPLPPPPVATPAAKPGN